MSASDLSTDPLSFPGELNSCLLIAKDGKYLLLKGFLIDCFDQRSPDDGHYWVPIRNGLDFRNRFPRLLILNSF